MELDELEEEEGADLMEHDVLDPFDKPIDAVSASDDDSDDDDDGAEGLGDFSSDEEELDSDGLVGKTDGERAIEHIRELVAKLDSIMKVTFDHLDRLNSRYTRQNAEGELESASSSPMDCSLTGTSKPDQLSAERGMALRHNLFHTMLSIFARTILPTFKSRHVQFLLFWFSSLDAEYSDLFLGVLLSKGLYGSDTGAGGEEPTIIRVAAASYVGSLVSRAAYIDRDNCRAVVLNLCVFLDAHLETCGSEAALALAPAGGATHAVFYAVAQALFYIFCFRWRDLQIGADEDAELGDAELEAGGTSSGALAPGAAWADGLGIVQRAITSPLNPLRVSFVHMKLGYSAMGLTLAWSSLLE